VSDAPAPAPAPAPAAAAPPPAGTEARQDQAIAELRAEQQRQGGVLEEIRGMLRGAAPAAATTADPPPAAPDITAQMKTAIREVNAETAPAAPPRPRPETRPREVGQPRRQRLQKILFGAEAPR
jgi:hypothetical protein